MVQETRVQCQIESYQIIKNVVFDATLLSTQQYKARITGKVEQSRDWSSFLPVYRGVVVIEKGAFESPSIKVIDLGISYWSNRLLLNRNTKVGDYSRGWPEGYLYNSYYTEA